MTQPPQPPNQPPQQPYQPNQPPQQQPPQGGFGAPQDPPQGGFGAPQDPPPGAFGAPTPPPQGPGCGYPQTPPGQPGQPVGYGYPPAPGAGQPPTQPMGQQPYGYGYPTQPHYGPPQPPGKKLSTQMQIIIAAVVAVVLIVAGGVWFAAGDDDTKQTRSKGSAEGANGEGDKDLGGGGKEQAPDNTKSKVSFQLPQPKVDDVTVVDGSWVTDKAYVKTGSRSVVGYDAAKGSVLWTIPLPGQLCAASRHKSDDNKTAIAFEPAKRTTNSYQRCSQVGAIDLEAGKLLWTKTAKGEGDEPVAFNEITLSGNTVAAGGTDGGAAFDLTTGAVRWQPQANAEECYDMGYGGGPALVAARKCGPYDSQYVVIQSLNPTTGAPLSSYKMPPGVEYASIISTKPLVVAADVGDTAGDGSGISDFFSIDEKTGKLKVKIAADADRYAAQCRSTEVESCNKAVVGNGRLYLPTEEHEGTGDYGDTNEIVSFDLTTGKPTSDKADAGDRYTMFPLRMDGGSIIAYKWPPYDGGGQIVSIDGGTFKQTVLMENPADESIRDAETSFSSDYAEILFSAGRLYISETLLSKPSPSANTDDKEYLAVAFSTD
ncbi:PQQ-binding-like beta-propeller repeat protein [Streptomyces sp. NPDC059909]|uniref:outer membrane protein assembly factor BamB family protein n=1 Tax=Streptomyces sp. NPDC059909 TaxID=3346998 RepID=UPI0036487CE4